MTLASQFQKDNSGLCLSSVQVEDDLEVKIVEYAPNIFRNIRKNICSEKLIFDSFKPSENMNAMHNF